MCCDVSFSTVQGALAALRELADDLESPRRMRIMAVARWAIQVLAPLAVPGASTGVAGGYVSVRSGKGRRGAGLAGCAWHSPAGTFRRAVQSRGLMRPCAGDVAPIARFSPGWRPSVAAFGGRPDNTQA